MEQKGACVEIFIVSAYLKMIAAEKMLQWMVFLWKERKMNYCNWSVHTKKVFCEEGTVLDR